MSTTSETMLKEMEREEDRGTCGLLKIAMIIQVVIIILQILQDSNL